MDPPAARPSLTKRLSSAFLGDTGNGSADGKNNSPAFVKCENVGSEMASIIQSNLDKIPDESLIKLTRQLEFWKEHGDLSNEQMIDLTKRLVHTGSWRSRLADGDSFHVPHVRFGRTELQMPIVTTGGMRIQHTWMPDSMGFLSANPKKVLASDSQKNLKEVLQHCIELGLNHIETARMYGTSELQFVDALASLIEEGKIKREDFIFQTKVMPAKTREEFEKTFNLSWNHVSKLGYIDLFAFHAVSKDSDVDMVLNEDKDGCYAFIKEYQEAGKIKNIGFSTHGTGETIMRMVESNKFDYMNVHAHYFGDYHGEGTPNTQGGHGNKAAVKKALELDMGVFLISPYDKGGKLFRPSKTVAKAVGPELSPISFASLYAWKKMGCHTVSVGFSKVSDLDEVLEAAYLYKEEKTMDLLDKAVANLEKLAVDKLGQDWVDKGMINIPSCLKESTDGVAIGHILWLHDLCTAYGMYEFARDRYKNLDSSQWNSKKTFEENVSKMPSGNIGRAYQPNVDLTEALKDHYDPELVKKKIAEAHQYLTSKKGEMSDEERQAKGFEEAYNLTVWVDFCGDMNTMTATKVMLQSLTGGYFGINNTSERRSSQAAAATLRQSFEKALEGLGDDK
mmetsp:Transcript_21172/g.29938  ORF Transcript_21172/g.29938 Transcript_21172/m.29938 type:complete len:621 (+) Transcript_21172:81-1943(+)